MHKLGGLWSATVVYGVPQWFSQGYVKGVLNSPDLCLAQTQIHHLGQYLATIDNACHLVSFIIVLIKSLTMCALYVTY